MDDLDDVFFLDLLTNLMVLRQNDMARYLEILKGLAASLKG